jgi:hypothetical protein
MEYSHNLIQSYLLIKVGSDGVQVLLVNEMPTIRLTLASPAKSINQYKNVKRKILNLVQLM